MNNTITSDLELFGSDIALDNNFMPLVAANGELILTSGCNCALQNVSMRLYVMLGSLFYDVEYGSLVLNWINEESTPQTRAALVAEVERRVNIDPHVVPGSATCKVNTWDHTGVVLGLDLVLINQAHPDHLVLHLAPNTGFIMEIISHANPRESARP